MSSPTHYHILRSLLGAAEAGFFPGVLFYLTTWIPASRRGQFTAFFMAAIAISGIGAFFAPTIVGWIATQTGTLSYALIFYAVLMAAGAIVMLAGTKPVAGHRVPEIAH